MRTFILTIALSVAICGTATAQYLGNYTANPYLPPAPPQPPGTFSNPYGTTFNSPKLYDSQGGYHGNLNANQFDPNSVANPFGPYGSRYSPNSINNPFSPYGSRYGPQSPNNPYGMGMGIYR
jgi:hypothetical protein